jgi:hypothetical protein
MAERQQRVVGNIISGISMGVAYVNSVAPIKSRDTSLRRVIVITKLLTGWVSVGLMIMSIYMNDVIFKLTPEYGAIDIPHFPAYLAIYLCVDQGMRFSSRVSIHITNKI